MNKEMRAVLKELVREVLLEVMLEGEAKEVKQVQEIAVDENPRNNSGQTVNKKKKTSSRFKGVYWNKKRNTFQAMIKYKYKLKYLGCGTEEECAVMYDNRALELRGRNAETNRSNGLLK
jgi:hypothetical protein